MRSIRRRAFYFADCLHEDKYKTQNAKFFGFAFYKKRTGVRRGHERKAKKNRNTEQTERSDNKKDRLGKYDKNAMRLQSGILRADLFTQREITKE